MPPRRGVKVRNVRHNHKAKAREPSYPQQPMSSAPNYTAKSVEVDAIIGRVPGAHGLWSEHSVARTCSFHVDGASEQARWFWDSLAC
jgi:hypothetical protein